MLSSPRSKRSARTHPSNSALPEHLCYQTDNIVFRVWRQRRAKSFSVFSFFFSAGFRLACPCRCTRLPSLSKKKNPLNGKWEPEGSPSWVTLQAPVGDSRLATAERRRRINFIYQLVRRENGYLTTSLVPLPPINSLLLEKQLKPD